MTTSCAPSAATAARPTSSIPDVGPRPFRYSESDRDETPRFWMAKLQREANAFAHEVVRAAASFPQMVIASPALRAGYARLVEWEIFRVIEGRSTPQPTREDEPMTLDASAYQTGVPELVAAELVRDVVEPKEFDEFCRFDCVTVLNGGKYYRIPRRPHGLIEVWDARTRRAEARLCVVFQDPGMPPSDEVVMKYLLAKHQPDLLWQVGVKFSPPHGPVRGRRAEAMGGGLSPTGGRAASGFKAAFAADFEDLPQVVLAHRPEDDLGPRNPPVQDLRQVGAELGEDGIADVPAGVADLGGDGVRDGRRDGDRPRERLRHARQERDREDVPAARARAPGGSPPARRQVGDVLQGLRGQDEVKRRIGIRQPVRSSERTPSTDSPGGRRVEVGEGQARQPSRAPREAPRSG